jgi:hypothetical protein
MELLRHVWTEIEGLGMGRKVEICLLCESKRRGMVAVEVSSEMRGYTKPEWYTKLRDTGV